MLNHCVNFFFFQITVAIPKLSTRVEDWLQKKVPRPAEECAARAARPSSLPHRIRSETALTGSSTPGSSCSLNNWLSLIKQHADLEEEHDFEITDNTARQNGKSVYWLFISGALIFSEVR